MWQSDDHVFGACQALFRPDIPLWVYVDLNHTGHQSLLGVTVNCHGVILRDVKCSIPSPATFLFVNQIN